MDNTKTNAMDAINKAWKPNMYLTSLSMAYFQQGEYAARQLFPVCPVRLKSGHYYIFDKADLARDNVRRKPAYGAVDPAVVSQDHGTYSCEVEQLRIGIDQIEQLNYERSAAPGAIDLRRSKVKVLTEQLNIHQDVMFAEKFFQKNVWDNQWTGKATPNANNKEFKFFTDASFDVIGFFDSLKTEIAREGRRKPNKLALGVKAFNALKTRPDILDRVKYTGTNQTPSMVTENVLAQLFGVAKVVVLDSTYNAAKPGKPADMRYICDSKGALLLYATDTPQIDEPSAGYTFTWDMLGNNQYVSVDQYPGPEGTHSEYIEGLMATDMRICAQDLAVYLADCVA